MNTHTALVAVAMTGLVLAACDSKAENEVERQATAIDEAYEADANLEEAVTKGGPEEKAGERRADALREKGETIKDHLEDEADELDAAPQ